MPIRAITSVIEVSQVSVAEAINLAVDQGAYVISMSLGGVPAAALERAVRRAVAADVIVLAAAGNCVRTVVWPARYEDCIAVAGTNAADGVWKGTCRGTPWTSPHPPRTSTRHLPRASSPSSRARARASRWRWSPASRPCGSRITGVPTSSQRPGPGGRPSRTCSSRLLRATARRPDGWDLSQMGAGIADARALLAADLDFGRDRDRYSPRSRRPDRNPTSLSSWPRRSGWTPFPAPVSTGGVTVPSWRQPCSRPSWPRRRHLPTPGRQEPMTGSGAPAPTDPGQRVPRGSHRQPEASRAPGRRRAACSSRGGPAAMTSATTRA